MEPVFFQSIFAAPLANVGSLTMSNAAPPPEAVAPDVAEMMPLDTPVSAVTFRVVTKFIKPGIPLVPASQPDAVCSWCEHSETASLIDASSNIAPAARVRDLAPHVEARRRRSAAEVGA